MGGKRKQKSVGQVIERNREKNINMGVRDGKRGKEIERRIDKGRIGRDRKEWDKEEEKSKRREQTVKTR